MKYDRNNKNIETIIRTFAYQTTNTRSYLPVAILIKLKAKI